MAGKVIALIQEKGGSKKTTNCVNIAGCLISMGYKVALVEMDSGNPDLTFWVGQGDFFKEFFKIDEKNPTKKFIELKKSYDFVLVDTPPNLGDGAIKAAMLADHIIIPTSESYLELKSVTTIVALAIEYKTPYSILLSNVDIKTLAFRDAQKALSGMEGLLDSYVSRSTRMAECPATGTWIGDYWPSNILHLQYKRVTKELLSKLKGEKNEK